MTIKNDLSSLKVGDKVFHITYGDIEVLQICKNDGYPLNVGVSWSSLKGRLSEDHKHPSLFLSAKHASEYFASIKEKKPIHVNTFIHHILCASGNVHSYPTRFKGEQSVHKDIGDTYLGCTEINKTYEIEE